MSRKKYKLANLESIDKRKQDNIKILLNSKGLK